MLPSLIRYPVTITVCGTLSLSQISLTHLVDGNVAPALGGGPVVGVHLDVGDLHGHLVAVGPPQVVLPADHAVLGHAVA